MPRELSYVPATEALLELVRTGLGVGVFARWAVSRRVRDGELAAIPLTKAGRRRTWSAAVRRGVADRRSTETLVALLRAHAPDFKAPTVHRTPRAGRGGRSTR